MSAVGYGERAAYSSKGPAIGDAGHGFPSASILQRQPSSLAQTQHQQRTTINLDHISQPLRSSKKTATPATDDRENRGAAAAPPKARDDKHLPRSKDKVRPASPPPIIRDNHRTLSFEKVGFLGEGGFARVYEVKDPSGTRHAIKVVSKESLKTKKAKTKLYAEIKIHRSLDHPNIVAFEGCFEDDLNVYMTLELCESGSLMDMLRRRKRFTEPEARFFLVQLIGACLWMHTHQVIHRDLKLGNIFMDADLNVKVGDFGLAALIENPGDRKKTICGTPNYIAPEVLFDTDNGHSFEVDTWSIGVILYTLIIGKPPFQTKDVKAIYKRIRDNQYEFPLDRPISPDAKNLISSMLTSDPQQRPNLRDVLEHPFFTYGTVPAKLPSTAHDMPPDFRYITPGVSRSNLAKLKKSALIDEADQNSNSLVEASTSEAPGSFSTAPSGTDIGGKARTVPAPASSGALAQQEREFQKAVQPGSPISILLKSAQQPLLTASASAGLRNDSASLIKKLAATKIDDARTRNGLRGITETPESGGEEEPPEGFEDGLAPGLRSPRDTQRMRAVDNQKARLLAQMAAAGATDEGEVRTKEKGKGKSTESTGSSTKVANKKAVEPAPAGPSAPSSGSKKATIGTKANSFDIIERTLTEALDARANGEVYEPQTALGETPDAPNFIVAWVDYCNKYGMGYALTDGTVGVHFNDSTSLILSPNKCYIDYVATRRQGTVYVRKNFELEKRPDNLSDKTYLLRHFERYMLERLYGSHDYTYTDEARTQGMDFVQKYLRMKHVIVFKMSHDVVQFNFMDHTKLIISHDGLLLTYLDKNYQCSRQLTVDLLDPSVQESEHQLQRAKDKLISKVKYARDVLKLIRSGEVPTFNGVPAGKEGEPEAVEPNAAGGTEEEAPVSSKPRTRSSTTTGVTSTVRGTRANPR